MNMKRLAVGSMCALLAVVVTWRANAQEKGEPSGDDMMKAWMAANMPNEYHEVLGKMVGTWKTKSRFRPDADAPWTESTAVSELKMIMGGRFLQEHLKGEMMPGMPFEGMGITGYDNTKKKYTSSWIDSTTTAIMTSLGTIDDSKKVLTFHGEVDDPMTGKTKPNKTILRLLNDEKFVVEMYDKDANGEWYKSLEVVYTK